jgi:hypothetical protein
VRPLFKAPREDGSWFRAELDCGEFQNQASKIGSLGSGTLFTFLKIFENFDLQIPEKDSEMNKMNSKKLTDLTRTALATLLFVVACLVGDTSTSAITAKTPATTTTSYLGNISTRGLC